MSDVLEMDQSQQFFGANEAAKQVEMVLQDGSLILASQSDLAYDYLDVVAGGESLTWARWVVLNPTSP